MATRAAETRFAAQKFLPQPPELAARDSVTRRNSEGIGESSTSAASSTAPPLIRHLGVDSRRITKRGKKAIPTDAEEVVRALRRPLRKREGSTPGFPTGELQKHLPSIRPFAHALHQASGRIPIHLLA